MLGKKKVSRFTGAGEKGLDMWHSSVKRLGVDT